MSALVPPKPRVARLPGDPARATAAVIGSAVVAALLGYAFHHLGPLRDHAVASVAVGVGLAAMIAGLPAMLAARRSQLPDFVVARPGDDRVREAHGGDLDFAAALHGEALEHGFFTRLGPRFLRAYHRTFAESPHAVAFVATVGGHSVGVLLGVLRPHAHARWTLRHRGPRLALLGALALVPRPLTALRFLRTRATRYAKGWRRNRGSGGRAASGEQPAVLSHVAVHPGARGVGAGGRLVEAFVAACRLAAIGRATLLTLEGPSGAGAFYARLGWHPGPVHTTSDGMRMIEWNLDVE